MRERNKQEREREDERFAENLSDELELQRLDLKLLRELHRLEEPRLSIIKVSFTHTHHKEHYMSTAVQGPAILTAAGQVAIATILGFDQFGAPMAADFKLPIAAYSSDDTAGAIVISKDNGDGTDTVTAVANGVANITAEVVTAEGKTLTDTESVTVAIVVVPPPTPVLSSIKVGFTGGTTPAPAGGPLPTTGPVTTAAAPAAPATVRFAGPQHTGAAS